LERAPHFKETAMSPRTRTVTIALSLVAFGITGTAGQNHAKGGAPPRPANRIVGLWSTQGTVSGCATGIPVVQVRNNLLFHAGGTVTENIAPVTTRNQGMGVWSYDQHTVQHTREYQLHLRFDRFANGAYIGSSTVDRQLLMSADGQQMSGAVRTTHYALDGSVSQELCGEAVSDRLY
jgi:hypothetical protein